MLAVLKRRTLLRVVGPALVCPFFAACNGDQPDAVPPPEAAGPASAAAPPPAKAAPASKKFQSVGHKSDPD